MPRRARKGNGRKAATGSGRSGNKTVRVPFRQIRYYTTDTTNFDVAYIQLRPDQLGTRLTNIRDTYNLFRCTHLRLKSIFPYGGVDNTTSAVHGVAFNQQYLPTNPAYWDQFVQFGRAELQTGFHTCEIRMGPRELFGQDPFKWFRTNEAEPTGTAIEDLTTQGYLYWASERRNGLGSIRHLLEIEGVMEFCQPKDTALDLAHDDAEVKLLEFHPSSEVPDTVVKCFDDSDGDEKSMIRVEETGSERYGVVHCRPRGSVQPAAGPLHEPAYSSGVRKIARDQSRPP